MNDNIKKILDDVYKVDAQAYNNLMDILNKDSFSILENTNNLKSLMLWTDTPQGHNYWKDIYMRIGKLKYHNRNGANDE